jgi:exopolysaccharide biosynthesis polyprenyl glycosylphosphotransferase
MIKKDTSDVFWSVVAVVTDACAIFGGFTLATWIRFDSGAFAVPLGRDPDLYAKYLEGAGVATLLFVFLIHWLRLYVRPQIGRFENRIPRIIRASVLGILLTMVVAFSVKNDFDFSRLTIGIAFFTITFFVLLERYILFRLELHYARHCNIMNHVLILGTDGVAGHIMRGLQKEPKLRSKVVGFLRTDKNEPDGDVPRELILGNVSELPELVSAGQGVDQIILADASLGHARIVDLILFCERHLVTFNMVPDLFRILTASMTVQSIDDIPLLGVSSWPLDRFWNRALKRAEDIVGGVLGLLMSAPVMAVAALLIKRSSPGPVFFAQERCGENGTTFDLYKLRTMREDAEIDTGPVFTAENDPRTTRVGAFLRRHNLDELPQLWNVLKGDMSLVGPRPERPYFVEQFKEDVGRYMWRHVSKPGLTGWAQINGLRGNTSIQERIKYDLYYLENWSLSFDFKILVKTFSARENAY